MGYLPFTFSGADKQKETLVKLITLSLSAIVAFIVRLFAVIRFESVIHEFDPYFNYRTTKYLTENGYYDFHNWFDGIHIIFKG
jgi:dolichyl-diphosphooligosaccharide--protein glycosyltransferase